MKNGKKIMSLLLASVMTLGLTSCGGGEANNNNGNNSNKQSGSYTDYSGGFKENVTIKIPVYDRAFEGWNVTDNYYTQWMQKEFGDKYNVTVQYVAIGRSTEVNDYIQMLASHTAPDIVFHYDMPQAVNYYSQEVLQPIDLEEMKYYAPTYYEMTAEMTKNYGEMDGETYFFFAERPTAYNWVTLVRQDWIDKVGMKMPTNLDEYNAMLKAWKDAGLGNGGGNLVQNNFTYSYAYRTWPIDSKERALYSDLSVADFTWAPTKAYLKNLNYQFNNGLIDTEFYLKTEDSQVKADFVAGKSGIYSLYLTSNTDVISSLLKNCPEAKLSVLDPYATVPKGNVPQDRAYWPFGMIMGLNADTTAEQRAALWMFLDWMAQDENLFKLQNGVEGQNYTKDSSGFANKVADYNGESKLSNNNNKDYWCLVIESAQYPDETLNQKANLLNWAPAGYEYLIETALENFNKTNEYRTPDALFTVTVESVSEYKTDLNNLWKELYVKCTTCKESEFEKTYEDACKEYLKAGYQQILDEKQKAIDAGSYK